MTDTTAATARPVVPVFGDAAVEMTDGVHCSKTQFGAHGTLTVAAVVTALADADIDTDLAPKGQSDEDLLGSLCRPRSGLIFRYVGSGTYPETAGDKLSGKRYASRWRVGRDTDKREVGESMAKIGMTIDLVDGEPVVTYDDAASSEDHNMRQIGRDIVTKFRERRESQTLNAKRVAQWIRETMARTYKAQRVGADLIVLPEYREAAAEFTRAIEKTGWGRWYWQACAYGSTKDIKAAIARSFFNDIEDVRHHWETLRTRKAREMNVKNKKEADKRRTAGEPVPAHLTKEITADDPKSEITGKVATRLLKKLAEIDAIAVGFRVVCGEHAIAPARALLKAMQIALGELGGNESIRFSLIEIPNDEEMAREAAEAEAEHAANRSAIERKIESEVRAMQARKQAAESARLPDDWQPPGVVEMLEGRAADPVVARGNLIELD